MPPTAFLPGAAPISSCTSCRLSLALPSTLSPPWFLPPCLATTSHPRCYVHPSFPTLTSPSPTELPLVPISLLLLKTALLCWIHVNASYLCFSASYARNSDGPVALLLPLPRPLPDCPRFPQASVSYEPPLHLEGAPIVLWVSPWAYTLFSLCPVRSVRAPASSPYLS